jgi:hypothetical protein
MPVWNKGVKRHPSQPAQIACVVQVPQAFLLQFPDLAPARNGTPEIGMSEGHITPEVACPMANGAHVSVGKFSV